MNQPVSALTPEERAAAINLAIEARRAAAGGQAMTFVIDALTGDDGVLVGRSEVERRDREIARLRAALERIANGPDSISTKARLIAAAALVEGDGRDGLRESNTHDPLDRVRNLAADIAALAEGDGEVE